jgi:hypothetical protein
MRNIELTYNADPIGYVICYRNGPAIPVKRRRTVVAGPDE